MNNIQSFVNQRFGRSNPNLPESLYKERLGIPKKTFGKYLRNQLQPRTDELQRIANWLGVEPKDLVNF